MRVKISDLRAIPFNEERLQSVLRNELGHTTSNLNCWLRVASTPPPIVLDRTGTILDGCHRVCVAVMRKEKDIEAVYSACD